MAKVLVTESSLADIADAIRVKTGGSDTYTPSEMAAGIGSIVQYPEPTGTKTITENGTGIDVKDYATADVAVPAPTLVTKNITANGIYNATGDSADGYSEVTVNVSGGGSSFTDDDANFLYSYDKTMSGLVGRVSFNEVTLSNAGTRGGQNCIIGDVTATIDAPFDEWFPLLSKSSSNYGKSATSEDGHGYQAFYQFSTSRTSYPLFCTPFDGVKRFVRIGFHGASYTRTQSFSNFRIVVDGKYPMTLSEAALYGAIDAVIFLDGGNGTANSTEQAFANMFNILNGGTINGPYYSTGKMGFIVNAGHYISDVQFTSGYSANTQYSDGVTFIWIDDTMFDVERITNS